MPDVHPIPSIPTSILMPNDFSPSSRAASDAASDLAEHFQASLVMVNVVLCLSFFALTYAIPDDALRRKMGAHAERLLARCRLALTARSVNSTFSVEFGNDVAGAIIDIAEREHLNISTHGISGWHSPVFGSIAEKAVKLVQCPLLPLHSAKPETHLGSTLTARWNGDSEINGKVGQS
jgi:nucleotide-binding universal stress UspA family protein